MGQKAQRETFFLRVNETKRTTHSLQINTHSVCLSYSYGTMQRIFSFGMNVHTHSHCGTDLDKHTHTDKGGDVWVCTHRHMHYVGSHIHDTWHLNTTLCTQTCNPIYILFCICQSADCWFTVTALLTYCWQTVSAKRTLLRHDRTCRHLTCCLQCISAAKHSTITKFNLDL